MDALAFAPLTIRPRSAGLIEREIALRQGRQAGGDLAEDEQPGGRAADRPAVRGLAGRRADRPPVVRGHLLPARSRRLAIRADACRSRAAAGAPSPAHRRSSGLQSISRTRVHQEHEPSAGAQQPRCLRNPAIRVAPDARAVLRDGEVEAGVRDTARLRRCRATAETRGCTRCWKPARGRELGLGVVDPDRPRATPRQPRGHVGRAAAELDRVVAGEIGGKHPDLGLRHVPDPPARLVLSPVFAGRGVVLLRPAVPLRAVAHHVVGKLAHPDRVCSRKAKGRPRGAALLRCDSKRESGLVRPGGTSSRRRFSPALGVEFRQAAHTLHAPRRRSRDGGNGRPPSGPAPPASRKVCDSVGPPPFSGPLIEACAAEDASRASCQRRLRRPPRRPAPLAIGVGIRLLGTLGRHRAHDEHRDQHRDADQRSADQKGEVVARVERGVARDSVGAQRVGARWSRASQAPPGRSRRRPAWSC